MPGDGASLIVMDAAATKVRWWAWPALWWAGLAVQVWFGWELHEVYLSTLVALLMLLPELVYGLLGIGMALGGLLKNRRAKGRALQCVLALTALTGGWMVVTPAVPVWGAHVHLWRNESVFLEQVEVAKGLLVPGEPATEFPKREGVFVEGEPARFGFHQRWIGMFHWTALVYDPARTLESKGRSRRFIFNYSLLGYRRLRGDWFVVWAMK